MSDKKKKLRKIASGDSLGIKEQTYSGHSSQMNDMTPEPRYPLAEEYQETGGKSTPITVEGTDNKTRVAVGRSTYSQSDRGMTPTAWKRHITSRGALPALARGVEHFEFNGETYSLTETARDGSPLVVRK